MSSLFTVGELTRHLRESHKCRTLEIWHVTRTIGRMTLKLGRVGRYRVVEFADIPAIEAALMAAGYLPARKK